MPKEQLTSILFISSTDGALFVSSDGNLPRVPNDDLARFVKKSLLPFYQDLHAYELDIQDQDSSNIIAIVISSNADDTLYKFFTKHKIEASWRNSLDFKNKKIFISSLLKNATLNPISISNLTLTEVLNLRKNPMFNSEEFRSESDSIWAGIDELNFSNEVSELKGHFSKLKDFLTFLKFMTPFSIEIFQKQFELRPIACKRLAKCLNLSFDIEDRLKDWLVENITLLYTQGNPTEIATYLNYIKKEFNNASKQPPIDCDFPETIQNFNFFKDLIYKIPYTEESVILDMFVGHNILTIEIKHGFNWCLYVYLTSELSHVYSLLDCTSTYFAVKHEREIPGMKASSSSAISFSTINGKAYSPLWAHFFPTEISFYEDAVHITNFEHFQGKVSVTPDSFLSKAKDYQFAPVSTKHDVFNFVSRTQDTPRAYCFSWTTEMIRNDLNLDTDGSTMHLYGSDLVLLFARAYLIGYKLGDDQLQSVCLLNDLIETIPCYMEYPDDSIGLTDNVAYIGTKVGSKEALYKIETEHANDILDNSIVLAVVDNIIDYLESSSYRPKYDINRVYPLVKLEKDKKHSGYIAIDLSGQNLRGLNLDGYNFRNANLEGADLEGATLRHCILHNANLKNANLSNTNFQGANASGADFSGARLENANLTDAYFDKTILNNAALLSVITHQTTFRACKAVGANFNGAKLKEINMTDADLSLASFKYSFIINCNFNFANLQGANFQNATVRGSRFTSATYNDQTRLPALAPAIRSSMIKIAQQPPSTDHSDQEDSDR